MKVWAAAVCVIIVTAAGLVVPSNASAQTLTLPAYNSCNLSGSTAYKFDMEAQNATVIAQWLKDRTNWLATGTCAGQVIEQVEITNAIDCRLTQSTLAEDAEARLSGLAQLIDWLLPTNNPDVDDNGYWIGIPPSGIFSWITTQVSRISYSIWNCDVHPAVVGAIGQIARPMEMAGFMIEAGTNTHYATSCSSYTPLSGSAPSPYAGAYNYFPLIGSKSVYKVGCTHYWSSGNAEQFVERDLSLCNVRMDLNSTPTEKVNSGSPAELTNGLDWTTTSANAPCSGDTSPVGSEPGTCCTFPGFGPSDPPPPWSTRLDGCGGMTITSEDNSGTYFVVGDEVDFALSAVDPARPPAASSFPVVVSMNSGVPPAQEATLGALGPFTMTVPKDGDRFDLPDTEPRLLNYITFDLRCSDGTSNLVFYDPSGEGGPRRVDPGGRADLDACLASTSSIGLDPSSWVPGLVERFQCVFEWLVTPSKPLSFHMAAWSGSARGTSTGEAYDALTAPYSAFRNAANNATTVSSINVGGTVTQLPVPSADISDRIKFGLELAVILSVGLWAIRKILAALGLDSGASPGDDER